MKRIFVRPLRMYDEADKEAFILAADASGKEFPKDVFTLPSTRIMVAEAEGEILVYQPHYLSLNVGSIIHTPTISDSDLASAQHMLIANAFTRAHTEGFADIIALSNNLKTRAFAKRHRFNPCKDVMRMDIR